jgi:ABC-type transport system involved in multi-copper enzyme maturation permease subunit
MTGSSQFIGAVFLALFAAAVAGEYGQGTLRNLLVRQPRRITVLAGKITALLVFTAVVLAVALIAGLGAAYLIAPGQDVATDRWLSPDGLWAFGSGYVDVTRSSRPTALRQL